MCDINIDELMNSLDHALTYLGFDYIIRLYDSYFITVFLKWKFRKIPQRTACRPCAYKRDFFLPHQLQTNAGLCIEGSRRRGEEDDF
jgi:hypothetical protein